MSPAIEAKGLSKIFKVHKREPGFASALRALFHKEFESVNAVKDISFQIEPGEIVGFLGPNGAGKTTTLKMLSGLLYPSSGFINTLGRVPQKREKEFLRSITLVMGNRSQLWWEIPIEESFRLNQAIYEVPEAQYQESLHELVELLEIKDLLRTPSKKLSLGQRMKAELVVSLLHRPKLLLLDEPTLGLDVMMQKKIRQFLGEYNRRHQATLLLTSHNMDDVSELCPRVILIDHGSLLYDGSLKQLSERYAPNKKISLYFAQAPENSTVQEFKLVPSNGNHIAYHLEVPRSKVSETASRLLNQAGKSLPAILDLSIEEPAVEDVIRTIFTRA